MAARLPDHLNRLVENISEVERLVEIHAHVAGASAGRKGGVEILNKSGIVLLVACWESFVEDIAKQAFEFLLNNAKTHHAFPMRVLTIASKELKNSLNETKVWQLAGMGWKRVLRQHADSVLKRFTGPFHSPSSDNVDELFKALIDLRNISSRWSWQRMRPAQAKKKLDGLIQLRGSIAHRVKAPRTVTKADVVDHTHFINKLAEYVSNTLAQELEGKLGKAPWEYFRYVGNRKGAN